MLFDILKLINREKVISEQQILRNFAITKSTLEPILARLIKKKLIKQLPLTINCLTCNDCNEKALRYFTCACKLEINL